MDFEYDIQKSESNKVKHGIDFDEASRIWEDENMVVLKSKQILEESRLLAVGRISNKMWTVVYYTL